MANKQPKFTIYNVPLPANKYARKATYGMSPIGITIHETDNNAPARNEIAYMQRNDNWTSFHYAVDEKEVIQGLPLDRNGWHAADGDKGTGNRKTIAIEICRNYRTDDLSNYYAARDRAEQLVGWLMYVYGWDGDDIYTHNDWSGKNCPRVIRQEGYMKTFIANAIKHRNSYRDEVAPVAPSKPSGKLEKGTIVKIKQSAGKYANVDANIPKWVKDRTHTVLEVNSSSTMVRLKEINSWVNISDIEGSGAVTPAAPKPVVKTIQELADEVMAGKHGNGEARKKSLGKDYAAVQARIEEMLNTKPASKPTPKPTESNADRINRIANEILNTNHNYGTGATRKQKLGKDFDAVQARINEILYGKTPSKPASKPATSPIKVGDMVLVKRGAKSYNGTAVTSAWYVTPKKLSELNGNRAVLDLGGWSTAFNINDIYKA